MSNLPPPTSGGAPYQPEQPTVAFNPLPPITDPASSSAPKKSSKGKLIGIIAAAVVVVAGLVVAGIVVFGGGDDEGNVDAAKASGAVEDTTLAANLDRTTNLALLQECPFGGLDDLADDAPKGFDAKGAADEDDRAAITQTDQREDPLLLQCVTTNDDASLRYGVSAAAIPPTELQDYIDRTLTGATGDFESTSSFRGGTLLPFCTTPDEDSTSQPLCATVWYDKQLMASIFAGGDGATSDLTTEWIKKSLDDVIEDLEGSDPDKVTVTDTQGFDLDSSAASTNLNAMVAAAAIGDAGSSAEQDSCLVADFATLQAGLPQGLDPSTLSGSPFNSLTRPDDEGDPAFMVCADASDDSTNQLGVLVGQVAPPDFEAYVKRSSQTDDVTFEDVVAFRGGELHPYCGTSASGTAFCESDWLTDDLQVGVFLAFDGVTSADTTALLSANIDSIVATTAAADVSAVKVPS